MAERILRLFSGYDITAPGADTDIIDSTGAGRVTPPVGVYALRVTVALTVSSVVNVSASDGTTPFVWGLNASAALNAGDLYVFEFACHSDPNTDPISYDLQV